MRKLRKKSAMDDEANGPLHNDGIAASGGTATGGTGIDTVSALVDRAAELTDNMNNEMVGVQTGNKDGEKKKMAEVKRVSHVARNSRTLPKAAVVEPNKPTSSQSGPQLKKRKRFSDDVGIACDCGSGIANSRDADAADTINTQLASYFQQRVVLFGKSAHDSATKAGEQINDCETCVNENIMNEHRKAVDAYLRATQYKNAVIIALMDKDFDRAMKEIQNTVKAAVEAKRAALEVENALTGHVEVEEVNGLNGQLEEFSANVMKMITETEASGLDVNRTTKNFAKAIVCFDQFASVSCTATDALKKTEHAGRSFVKTLKETVKKVEKVITKTSVDYKHVANARAAVINSMKTGQYKLCSVQAEKAVQAAKLKLVAAMEASNVFEFASLALKEIETVALPDDHSNAFNNDHNIQTASNHHEPMEYDNFDESIERAAKEADNRPINNGSAQQHESSESGIAPQEVDAVTAEQSTGSASQSPVLNVTHRHTASPTLLSGSPVNPPVLTASNGLAASSDESESDENEEIDQPTADLPGQGIGTDSQLPDDNTTHRLFSYARERPTRERFPRTIYQGGLE